MKQFTYKFFCLLSFLLIGGGNLTAQTLTQVTSLEEINETDSYVLYYNGAHGLTACYLYVNGTSMASTTTAPTGSNSYYFNFEKVSDGAYKIKSVLTSTYLSTNPLALGGTGDLTWNFEKYSSNSNFMIYFVNAANFRRALVGQSGSINTQSAGKTTSAAYTTGYCINIYKVETTETVDVTINYVDKKGNPIASRSVTVNKDEKKISDLLESFPTYIDAKYYLVEEGTETEIFDLSTTISADATYKVVTDYNENFIYPKTNTEYFALKSLHTDNTTYYYLGTSYGISSANYSNRTNIALRLAGDWYNGYSILDYNGNKLYLNGAQATFKSDQNYKWKINNENKIVSTDGNYLQIKDSYFTTTSWEQFAAVLASSEIAASILSGLTAEYVGAYDKSLTGTVTFDDLIKGNNGLDFTNGTYYFIETAADANTVLSSSDAKTTFGSAPTSATLATNASKGFNELWKYQDGKFVHANSGLQLTQSALYNTGNTWVKTATGAALTYKLNNGTTDLTVDANDIWKFRIAKSVTIKLTEKDGTSYATTCAPVALTLPEEDTATTLYIEKSHKENTLSFEAATAVAANTGIYIENASGETSATLLFAESGTTPAAEDQILYGTNVTLDISSDDHALYRTLGFNSASKIGFFKPASSIAQIPANRAFLHFTTAPTSAFYIDFDATTTGIDTLLPAAETELDKNAPVYDLSGRRIQGTLRTGIYLQNGRKFMVK